VATAAPSPTGTPVHPDGRIFGEVSSVDAGSRLIRFDEEQFLTGKAAQDAAHAQGQEVENDYFIKNAVKRIDTVTISASAEIVLVDWDHCCGTKPSDLAALAKYFQAGGRYAGNTGPFWLTYSGGMIVKIEEQFVP